MVIKIATTYMVVEILYDFAHEIKKNDNVQHYITKMFSPNL